MNSWSLQNIVSCPNDRAWAEEVRRLYVGEYWPYIYTAYWVTVIGDNKYLSETVYVKWCARRCVPSNSPNRLDSLTVTVIVNCEHACFGETNDGTTPAFCGCLVAPRCAGDVLRRCTGYRRQWCTGQPGSNDHRSERESITASDRRSPRPHATRASWPQTAVSVTATAVVGPATRLERSSVVRLVVANRCVKQSTAGSSRIFCLDFGQTCRPNVPFDILGHRSERQYNSKTPFLCIKLAKSNISIWYGRNFGFNKKAVMSQGNGAMSL